MFSAADEQSEIRPIDALRHFAARVDACLFVCRLGRKAAPPECRVSVDLSNSRPAQTFGLRDGRLVLEHEDAFYHVFMPGAR